MATTTTRTTVLAAIHRTARATTALLLVHLEHLEHGERWVEGGAGAEGESFASDDGAQLTLAFCGEVSRCAEPTVAGFGASSTPVRESLAPLARVLPIDAVPAGAIDASVTKAFAA